MYRNTKFILPKLGIPGLSFDVMLMFFQNSEQAKSDNKLTSESETSKPLRSLDVYSDPEMEHFFTKGIRGWWLSSSLLCHSDYRSCFVD